MCAPLFFSSLCRQDLSFWILGLKGATHNLKHLFGFFILAASLGSAQVTTLPFPGPGDRKVDYSELKTALTLSDAQLQQLVQLQTSHFQSNQTIYNQMSDKQKILSQQLSSDTPDSAAAGAAVVALAALRRQLNTAEKQFRDSAVALLTQAQRPKLQALDDARKLQTPIYQAVSLGLLEGSYAVPLNASSESGVDGSTPGVGLGPN
jgi:Spy/CpxP family protein refolding chaperone